MIYDPRDRLFEQLTHVLSDPVHSGMKNKKLTVKPITVLLHVHYYVTCCSVYHATRFWLSVTDG